MERIHLEPIITRYGSFSIPTSEDDLIGRFLTYYGEWAWDEVSFVASVLPDDARVLDIGACFGTFGLGVSMLRKLSYICFVDANPAVIPFLTYNVTHNATVRYTIKEQLIGSTGLKVAPAHGEPGNIGATSFVPDVSESSTQSPLPAVKELSDLWKEEGPFDLIKIDAEGMELSILDSHASLLSQGEVTLWLECNEDAQSLRLCERLLSWGLEVFYFAFPSHNPDNFNHAASPIFPFAYEAGLLVAPRNQPKLSEALRAHHCILRSIDSVEELWKALWETPRWGMANWVGKDLAAMAALAGHQLRGERFGAFLREGWQSGELVEDRLATLEESARKALSEAHDRTVAQQREIDSLSARCAALTGEIEREQEASREAQSCNQKLIDDLAQCRRALSAAQVEARQLEKKIAVISTNMLDCISETGQHIENTVRADIHDIESNMQKFISERDEQISIMRGLVDQYSDDMVLLQNSGQQLQEKIREIEISTVWRVTSPVRRIVSRYPLIRKVARSGRRIAAEIRNKRLGL